MTLGRYTRWLLLVVAMVSAQDPCGFNSIENELVTALYPPELMQTESGFQSMGVFTICARVSKYYKLAENEVTYNDVPALEQTTVVWGAQESTCWYVYNVTADWADLTASGLAVDDTVANVYRYRGAINVHSEADLVGDVYSNAFVRESDNPLLFEVLVPTTITVEDTGIEIFAAIAVQVVLVTHVVEVDALAVMAANAEVSAALSVATTIQYPFYLTGMEISTNNTNLALTSPIPTELPCSDPDPLTTPCTQTWGFETAAFDVMGTGETCPGIKLEAHYFLDWTVECFAAIADVDCPIDSTTDSGNAWVFLESSDICPSTVDQVDLAGSLDSYEDVARSSLKNAFFFEDTVYFKGTVSSDELDIVDAKVINIATGAPVLLYDEDSGFTHPDIALDLTDDPSPNVIHFAFVAAEDAFAGVPALGSAAFTIYATLEVQFEGLPPILLKKAFQPKVALLQDIESQPVNVGSDVSIAYAEGTETASVGEDAAAISDDDVLVEDVEETVGGSEKSDDWILAVVVVVSLVAALGACLACGYKARQRRHKRASVDPEHDQLASGSGSTCVQDEF